jgi:hypothetical protein
VSVFSEKAVTYAPFGDDVTRLGRSRLYFPAQTVNVDAQGVFEYLFQGPQATQEKIGGDGSTGVVHEDVKEFGLGRGEGHWLPVNDSLLVGEIHR